MSYKISVSCHKENLRQIRYFVEETLRHLQIPDADRHLLVVAVDEVCANRIIHAVGCNTAESIEVFIRRQGQEIIFEISDRGEVFNITEYTEPSLDDIIKHKKTGGIGLILVKKIIDKIQFETVGARQVCRLSKHFAF